VIPSEVAAEINNLIIWKLREALVSGDIPVDADGTGRYDPERVWMPVQTRLTEIGNGGLTSTTVIGHRKLELKIYGYRNRE